MVLVCWVGANRGTHLHNTLFSFRGEVLPSNKCLPLLLVPCETIELHILKALGLQMVAASMF